MNICLGIVCSVSNCFFYYCRLCPSLQSSMCTKYFANFGIAPLINVTRPEALIQFEMNNKIEPALCISDFYYGLKSTKEIHERK